MRLIRRLALAVYGPLVFVLLSLLGGVFGRAAWFRRRYPAQIRFWAVHLLRELGIEVRIDEQSRRYLRQSGFEIVAATHKSHLDSVVLWAVYPPEKQLRFVAKQELFRVPFLGTGLNAAGAVSIDRKKGRESLSLLRDLVLGMQRGESLLIFPEGTRTRGSSLGRFKKGAFVLAAESGRDLLPVCITGTHALMPPGRNLPGAGVVEVVVLPPVKVADSGNGGLDQLMTRVREDMNAVMGGRAAEMRTGTGRSGWGESG